MGNNHVNELLCTNLKYVRNGTFEENVEVLIKLIQSRCQDMHIVNSGMFGIFP